MNPRDTSIEPQAAVGDDSRMEDLAQIIESYSQVTDKLQRSHEKLQGEVVRMRQELTSANAQLQRSKRLSALGEMASGIAHEIRNPLAAIQLYAGMAIEDLDSETPLPDLAMGNLQKIASAVRSMSGIVNDVLSFARGIEPASQWHDVGELFDSALAAHAPGLDESGVDIRRLDLGRGSAQLFGDASLIQQALLNLVRNATDAMSGVEGGRVLTIDMESDDAGVVLIVDDTGPGIPEDSIDRIFNPFFTTRNTGTGLGLAIVHRIVDAHGGVVSVANQNGARFRLALPSPERPELLGTPAVSEVPGVSTLSGVVR